MSAPAVHLSGVVWAAVDVTGMCDAVPPGATRKVGVTLCTTVMLLESLPMCDIIHSVPSGATARSCQESNRRSGGLWQYQQRNALTKKRETGFSVTALTFWTLPAPRNASSSTR